MNFNMTLLYTMKITNFFLNPLKLVASQIDNIIFYQCTFEKTWHRIISTIEYDFTRSSETSESHIEILTII